MEPTHISAVFQAGPLGIGLADARQDGRQCPCSCICASVNPEGQAAALGVQPGDMLTHVNDVDVSQELYDAVLGRIRESPRPVTLLFTRIPEETSPAASPASTPTVDRLRSATEGAFKNLGKAMSVPAAPDARAAVHAASSMLTSLFSTGAQVVKALDRVLDKALDDSAKVAVAARVGGSRVSQGFLSQIARVTAGERSIRIGGLALDLSAAVPREALGEMSEDEQRNSAAIHAWNAAMEETLTQLRATNERNVKLSGEAAVALTSLRVRAHKNVDDIAALGRSLSQHVPAIRADVRKLSSTCASLSETLTTLEGKLTALTVARTEEVHDAWVKSQEAGMREYRASKDAALVQTRARLEEEARMEKARVEEEERRAAAAARAEVEAAAAAARAEAEVKRAADAAAAAQAEAEVHAKRAADAAAAQSTADAAAVMATSDAAAAAAQAAASSITATPAPVLVAADSGSVPETTEQVQATPVDAAATEAPVVTPAASSAVDAAAAVATAAAAALAAETASSIRVRDMARAIDSKATAVVPPASPRDARGKRTDSASSAAGGDAAAPAPADAAAALVESTPEASTAAAAAPDAAGAAAGSDDAAVDDADAAAAPAAASASGGKKKGGKKSKK